MYVLVTPPAEEPLTLEEAKAWARVDGSDEDGLISALIAAARQYVELETGRSLVTQTWRLDLDGFPASGAIHLGHGPVSSITTVAYRDWNDETQTLAAPDYLADALPADYPRLVAGTDTSWPDHQRQPGAVKITFVAGYGSADDVPDGLKTAMRFLIAHWFDNRSAVGTNDQSPLAMAAQALIELHTLPLLA